MYLGGSTEFGQTLLIFATTLLCLLIAIKWFQNRKLPPGPYGFPLVGYHPFLKNSPHLVFSELSKKYGNIFSINIGLSRIIVISDYNLAKQILNNPAAHGRPPDFSNLLPGRGGFAAFNGQEWQEQRRFSVGAMKNLGMGRGEWETMIHEEIDEFMKEIRGWKGNPKDFLMPLEFSQAGNTLSLLVGRRLHKDRSHPDSAVIMNFVDKIMSNASATSLAVHVPHVFLKLMKFLRIGGFNELLKAVSDFEKLIRKEITNHMASPPTDKPTFISMYLEEIKKQAQNDKALRFDVDSLIGSVTALFLGGADTTKASLHWLFLMIASRPEIQQKIHQEIDDVIGRDRIIYWDERNNLPYTMATINEIERWVAITPLFPPRWAMAPIEVDNYVIPKGATIIVNGWHLMHNQSHHKDPEVFKPERFLKSDNKQTGKLDGYIPFSTGKRNCPGEHVAMMTIFLYFARIMQKFRITCPSGKKIHFKDMGVSAVRYAVPQEICFIER